MLCFFSLRPRTLSQNCVQRAVSYPVMRRIIKAIWRRGNAAFLRPALNRSLKWLLSCSVFAPGEMTEKASQLHVVLTDPLSLALVRGWFQMTANRGVSASHIRFDLGLWLKRSLLESRCAQRSTCHLDIAFLVAKTYKWEHEILLKMAMPARPAGSPHHAQLELI